MALIIAAALGISALVGGLTTYTATKAFGNNPTHESVHALINTQLSQNFAQDSAHEFQQNALIIIIIAVIFVAIVIFFLKRMLAKLARPRAQQPPLHQIADP